MNQPDPLLTHFLPSLYEFNELLKIESCEINAEWIYSLLLNPLKDTLATNGKKLRYEMVELAFICAGGELDEYSRNQLQICEQIVEGLHLGSMIIDDVQDQSEIRRGNPTFHLKYGFNIAINAGNWLYFQALDRIRSLNLDKHIELRLRRNMNSILLKAHIGQGIDLSVNMQSVSQQEVDSIYFTSAELKTGALMELCFELGTVLCQKHQSETNGSLKNAKKFGVALQMLDDIWNFMAPPPKGKEDLSLGRPSFIWVAASRLSKSEDYHAFKKAIQDLPNPILLEEWNRRFNLVSQAKLFAFEYILNLKKEFSQSISETAQNHFNSIFKKLENSYV